MAEWWSIEVLHGDRSAFGWQQEHDSELIEAALKTFTPNFTRLASQ